MGCTTRSSSRACSALAGAASSFWLIGGAPVPDATAVPVPARVAA